VPGRPSIASPSGCYHDAYAGITYAKVRNRAGDSGAGSMTSEQLHAAASGSVEGTGSRYPVAAQVDT
jgi:hypothetical protein